MKNILLKYGFENIDLRLSEIPTKNIKILQQERKNKSRIIRDISTAIKNSLNAPIETPPLISILNKLKPELITIVIPDITRVMPYYKEVLKALINYIPHKYHKNIKFLIATGTHRPHTTEENIRLYGEELVKKFEFINHDCDNKKFLTFLGETSLGNKIYLNKYVINAQLVILTGTIDTHAFAGFSGGAKSLLPGVAGRDSITYNHSFVVDSASYMGNLKNNKIYQDIMETYQLLKQKTKIFCINFIKDSEKNLIKILSGNLEKVFKKGIEILEATSAVKIKKLSDLTIVSCGGYPRDINLYQAQKSLTCASIVTKPEGVIILVANCQEGIGQKIFADTLLTKDIDEILSLKQNEIEVEVHRAYLTAKILNNYKCILISSLNKKIVEKLKFIYAKNINLAIQKAKKYLKDTINLCYIIPDGSTLLPIIRK
ncbi:MAG: nickel-dependent lactate racemase [Endomicrobiia bacterium]